MDIKIKIVLGSMVHCFQKGAAYPRVCLLPYQVRLPGISWENSDCGKCVDNDIVTAFHSGSFFCFLFGFCSCYVNIDFRFIGNFVILNSGFVGSVARAKDKKKNFIS